MDGKSLIKSFTYTADIIRRHAAEIGHEESLIQPIAGDHSANWLLGHIVSSRSFPLQFVGEGPIWSDEERARYRDGSAPIGADDPGVIDFSSLIDYFDVSQSRLLAGLHSISEKQLNAPSGYASN